MSVCNFDSPEGGQNLSEINTKIPRSVRFEGASIKLLGPMLFVFLLLLLGGSWIAYRDISSAHVRNILRREGKVTYGEIVKSAPMSNGVHLRYKFLVDGVMYFGHADMITDHYTVPGIGGQIPIRYLEGDPRINLPTHWEWFSVWDIYSYLFLLFLMGVAGAIIVSGLRERTLARIGIVVQGRVTGCEPSRNLVRVYYEFTTRDNEVIEGSREMPEACDFGASIQIIYLPRSPKRNGIYPLGGFRIAE